MSNKDDDKDQYFGDGWKVAEIGNLEGDIEAFAPNAEQPTIDQ